MGRTIPDTMVDDRLEEIYSTLPPEEIPWDHEEPPGPLVELIRSGWIEPCRAIDLGCGAGNYSIYLASRGFDVTGIDGSPSAIELANERARKKGVECNFIARDLLDGLKDLGRFDFALEWQVMHHIPPEARLDYVNRVSEILEPGGKYLSVCFNEDDSHFPGSGGTRRSRLGTTLYLSTLDGARELFEAYFDIEEIKTIELGGTKGPHISNYVRMVKR